MYSLSSSTSCWVKVSIRSGYASASGRDAGGCQVLPALGRAEALGLGRAPASWLVGVDRRHLTQHGIDHPPGRLDRVLAREQALVAAHGIAKQPLVGRHLVW